MSVDGCLSLCSPVMNCWPVTSPSPPATLSAGGVLELISCMSQVDNWSHIYICTDIVGLWAMQLWRLSETSWALEDAFHWHIFWGPVCHFRGIRTRGWTKWFSFRKEKGVGRQSNILSKRWKTCDRTSAFVKSSSKSTRCCPANGEFICKAIRGDSKLLMFVLPARTTSHCLVVEAASFACAAHTGPGSAAFPQLSACRQSVLVKTAIYYPRVIMTVAVMAWRVAGQFSSLGAFCLSLFSLTANVGMIYSCFRRLHIWSCIHKYALFQLLAGHLWMF